MPFLDQEKFDEIKKIMIDKKASYKGIAYEAQEQESSLSQMLLLISSPR